MKRYYGDASVRKITQAALSSVQALFMVLSLIFMTLFVTTPAPSEADFSVAAMVFTVVWCCYYLLQVAFAVITFVKTTAKAKLDIAFLITSLLWLAVGVGLFRLILVFFS